MGIKCLIITSLFRTSPFPRDLFPLVREAFTLIDGGTSTFLQKSMSNFSAEKRLPKRFLIGPVCLHGIEFLCITSKMCSPAYDYKRGKHLRI